MKIISRYNIFLILLAALTLFSACERTELCYDHYPKASLNVDWEKEWERDYGMAHSSNWNAEYHGFDYDNLRPATPEWINMVKYKDNDSYGEHYLSSDGGEIMLHETGSHSFLFYNGDTEYIILSDIASLREARATTTSRSRSSISYVMERHPGVRSANPPDVLFSAFLEDVASIGVHQTINLPVKMQPLVYTYVVRYEFEYGAEHVALARGALGGMAESVYLRNGTTSDETIILLYDCEKKAYGFEAHVRSFGVPGFPDEYYGRSTGEVSDRPYTLNLEVLLTSGKIMEFNFDIDDQLKNQPRGGVIAVKGIRIEDDDNKTEMGSSGFDVDLSGWGEENVDLPL